jgi:alpha-L-fucosidase
MRYAPTLESLRTHPVPEWYHDAKLGIFIHWGLFSIPAFAPTGRKIHEVLREQYDDFVPLTPYCEWYENAIKFPWSPSARFHAERYGSMPYTAFREPFEEGLRKWDPHAWAELFRDAGARYVVLVTKHHDGFCLWPTREPSPRGTRWHTLRDVVGELAAAVRAQGLRFGVYYSGGIDWSFEPTPVRTVAAFLASVPDREPYPSYALAQCRELIERVAPDVLWNDIAWPSAPARLWQLLADYYGALPDGVVNDRWATPNLVTHLLRVRPLRAAFDTVAKAYIRRRGIQMTGARVPHCDFVTPEYATFDRIRTKKWEATRGLGDSFGWNRNEPASALLSGDELVRMLVDVVSKNGNLLLNLGPRGEDAAVPDEQAERVRALGRWLAANGEAVYGTRPWRRADGDTREGIPVRFTAKGEGVFAIAFGRPPGGTLTLANLALEAGGSAELLDGRPVPHEPRGPDLCLRLPETVEADPACVVALRGLRG